MDAPKGSLPDRLKAFAGKALHFLSSAVFLHNLLALAGTTLFFLLFVGWWLRCYTHHGEKLVVKNYIGSLLPDAMEDADDEDLRMVLQDSVFIVGKPGGMIVAQNPAPGSKVKEDRRIYVTATKYLADEIHFSSLPNMYGKEFPAIQKVLYQRFNIDAHILEEVFDEGPPNMVLAVVYQGDTLVDAKRRTANRSIPKGARLDFIISKDQSDFVTLPELECQPLSMAEFMLRANRLTLGKVYLDENVTNRNTAFVYKQEPAFQPDLRVAKGDTVSIWLTQARPARCPETTETLE